MVELMTPEVSRWVASWETPLTLSMAAKRIEEAREALKTGRSVSSTIIRLEDDRVVGWISVTRDSLKDNIAMIGYWLGEPFQGLGYMREIVSASLELAFDRLNVDFIEAAAQPENARSFATLRSCGMKPAGERLIFSPTRRRDELCLVYRLARPADSYDNQDFGLDNAARRGNDQRG